MKRVSLSMLFWCVAVVMYFGYCYHLLADPTSCDQNCRYVSQYELEATGKCHQVLYPDCIICYQVDGSCQTTHLLYTGTCNFTDTVQSTRPCDDCSVYCRPPSGGFGEATCTGTDDYVDGGHVKSCGISPG